jgi:hypothetical protein
LPFGPCIVHAEREVAFLLVAAARGRVVAWVEAQILAVRLTRLSAADYVRCSPVHCAPDERQTVVWNNVPLES